MWCNSNPVGSIAFCRVVSAAGRCLLTENTTKTGAKSAACSSFENGESGKILEQLQAEKGGECLARSSENMSLARELKFEVARD